MKTKENEAGTLASLAIGESAAVAQIDPECKITRRLYDLGFCRGETVTCMFKSPLGDPTAYLIRGAMIALRRRDAAMVAVKE